MRRAGALAQRVEARLRHEHARMDADQLGLERDLVGEQLVEGRDGLLRQTQDARCSHPKSRTAAMLIVFVMRRAPCAAIAQPVDAAGERQRHDETRAGPSTPATRNTGV